MMSLLNNKMYIENTNSLWKSTEADSSKDQERSAAKLRIVKVINVIV